MKVTPAVSLHSSFILLQEEDPLCEEIAPEYVLRPLYWTITLLWSQSHAPNTCLFIAFTVRLSVASTHFIMHLLTLFNVRESPETVYHLFAHSPQPAHALKVCVTADVRSPFGLCLLWGWSNDRFTNTRHSVHAWYCQTLSPVAIKAEKEISRFPMSVFCWSVAQRKDQTIICAAELNVAVSETPMESLRKCVSLGIALTKSMTADFN